VGAAMTDVDRSDEYLEWIAEDAEREQAIRNGQHPDDPGPPEPKAEAAPPGDPAAATDEATTWEPIDLGPYLRGEIERPQPALGIVRSDDLRLIYPGRQHVVVGETESGKSWFALACVAAELALGRHVVYVHFEESDPGSTLDRLQLLDVTEHDLVQRFRFVGPSRPVRAGWIEPLLTPVPSLVVFDGVNEGMALHGADIMAADGASAFRRLLVLPFANAGAATLACDHTPHGGRVAEYGSVHKGNALDGTRINLENVSPFGRRLRGRSSVFVTKDRPGFLRAHGRPTKVPGKTFMGTLIVDDSETIGPDFTLRFTAPKEDEEHKPGGDDGTTVAAGLSDTVHGVIAALPDRTVGSTRELYAQLRAAGLTFTNANVRNAVDDLIVAGRLIEVPGKNRAKGYQTADSSASDEPPS
jgi:hypothetical protein